MKVEVLLVAGLMALPTVIKGASSSLTSRMEKKMNECKYLEMEPKSHHHRSVESCEEEQQQHVTEEFEKKVMKVERRGDYLVGYIDVPAKKKSSEREKVEYLDPRAATYDKREERRKIKKKNHYKSTHFNHDIDLHI